MTSPLKRIETVVQSKDRAVVVILTEGAHFSFPLDRENVEALSKALAAALPLMDDFKPGLESLLIPPTAAHA